MCHIKFLLLDVHGLKPMKVVDFNLPSCLSLIEFLLTV